MDAEGCNAMQDTAKKNCRAFDNTASSTVELPRILLDRKRAAAMLSISVRALDYLTSSGAIRVRRIGGRVLVPIKELQRFADTDRSEPLVPVAAPVLVRTAA
jgi:hypothetical protein